MATDLGARVLEDDDARGAARMVIDERVYTRPAIHGAAASLLPRAHIRLFRVGDERVEAQLRPRPQKGRERALSADELCGEMANELLNQLVRLRLGDTHERLRAAYLSKMFSTREATLDALLAELGDTDLDDDDLEISVPWADDTAGSSSKSEAAESTGDNG